MEACLQSKLNQEKYACILWVVTYHSIFPPFIQSPNDTFMTLERLQGAFQHPLLIAFHCLKTYRTSWFVQLQHLLHLSRQESNCEGHLGINLSYHISGNIGGELNLAVKAWTGKLNCAIVGIWQSWPPRLGPTPNLNPASTLEFPLWSQIGKFNSRQYLRLRVTCILKAIDKFSSHTTGQSYNIKFQASCKVVLQRCYLTTCSRCGLQYAEEASQPLHARLNGDWALQQQGKLGIGHDSHGN